jgi:hypothetical protein
VSNRSQNTIERFGKRSRDPLNESYSPFQPSIKCKRMKEKVHRKGLTKFLRERREGGINRTILKESRRFRATNNN